MYIYIQFGRCNMGSCIGKQSVTSTTRSKLIQGQNNLNSSGNPNNTNTVSTDSQIGPSESDETSTERGETLSEGENYPQSMRVSNSCYNKEHTMHVSMTHLHYYNKHNVVCLHHYAMILIKPTTNIIFR